MTEQCGHSIHGEQTTESQGERQHPCKDTSKHTEHGETRPGHPWGGAGLTEPRKPYVLSTGPTNVKALTDGPDDTQGKPCMGTALSGQGGTQPQASTVSWAAPGPHARGHHGHSAGAGGPGHGLGVGRRQQPRRRWRAQSSGLCRRHAHSRGKPGTEHTAARAETKFPPQERPEAGLGTWGFHTGSSGRLGETQLGAAAPGRWPGPESGSGTPTGRKVSTLGSGSAGRWAGQGAAAPTLQTVRGRRGKHQAPAEPERRMAGRTDRHDGAPATGQEGNVGVSRSQRKTPCARRPVHGHGSSAMPPAMWEPRRGEGSPKSAGTAQAWSRRWQEGVPEAAAQQSRIQIWVLRTSFPRRLEPRGTEVLGAAGHSAQHVRVGGVRG